MWTSFEFYILKNYLVCWFFDNVAGSLFFYKIEKTLNLIRKIASLLELLLLLETTTQMSWSPHIFEQKSEVLKSIQLEFHGFVLANGVVYLHKYFTVLYIYTYHSTGFSVWI
jgi:hypothetical protein